MAFDGKSLDSYVDVATRLAEFRKDHPEGRIRPADPAMPYHVVRVPNGWCVRCKGAQTIKQRDDWKKCPRCDGSGVRHRDEPQEDVFIVYAAAAKRDADDTDPGVGMAWERYPGRTPYTADSELMNAETSAWGRALLAANVADARKGVASKDEVRNRAADRDEDGWPADAQPPAKQAKPSANGRTPGYVTAVQMAYKKLGFKDAERDDMLRASEQIIGHELTGPHKASDGSDRTHKNLTAAEARKLKDTLGGFGDRDALLVALGEAATS